MNLEAINKWLDEEYGCSYTKLEELHDFYFEKYCDLKKENKKLKKQLEEYKLQNINLRTDIMIKKMAMPNELIKDKTFYELYDMPTYVELLAQQKEFIEYLENMLDNENDIFSVVRVKDVLSKYKEIIGVSDDKTN